MEKTNSRLLELNYKNNSDLQRCTQDLCGDTGVTHIQYSDLHITVIQLFLFGISNIPLFSTSAFQQWERSSSLRLFVSHSVCHCRQTATPSAARPSVVITHLLESQTALLSPWATINRDSILSQTPGWMSQRWRMQLMWRGSVAPCQACSWACNLQQWGGNDWQKDFLKC